MRLAGLVFILVAIGLLGTALHLTLDNGPTAPKLARGVVFSAPLAATVAEQSGNPSPPPSSTETPRISAPDVTAAPSPQPTWAIPTPNPTPPPDGSPITRVIIPSIKVNARTTVRGVDRNGVMQDPESWDDISWYNFTGRPGFGTGNNAVFAGHVDYIRHGPAVFWDLNKLKPGDPVHIILADGTDYTYRVTNMAVYDADAAPVDEIIGDTPVESVTLITCNGTFSAGHYNNRLVVRAERPIDRPIPFDQVKTGE